MESTQNSEGSDNSIKRKPVSSWQFYLHKAGTSGDFGENSKLLKVKWRSMSSDEKLEFRKEARIGIEIPPCSKCGKVLNVLGQKNYHEKGCGDFVCPICNKAFKERRAMDSHHTGQHTDKFKCVTCGQCCDSNSKLKRHVSTHTRDMNVKCECGKSFTRKEHLRKHHLICRN